MSMTDQIPVQARRAAALLPEQPRYVGMVDVKTVVKQVDELRTLNLADSLRQAELPLLRSFLETTDVDLETDITGAYGALEGESALSVVLFASLTPDQIDRYVSQAPQDAGRKTTYRGAPLYHLALGIGEDSADTLSAAFVDEGTWAVSMDPDRVTAIIDRHNASQEGGLLANDSYMALVERVGRGSTAWLVGGDVVQAALQDSAKMETVSADEVPAVNQAGIQQALSQWSDRVLGLSKVSSMGDRASDKFGRLKKKLRDQALSLTLTDTALEGEVFLTMRDDASASSVVDVAEGVVAMLKLSGDNLEERHRDLLDEVSIERDGPIVHVQFSLDRDQIQKEMRAARSEPMARPADSSIHPIVSSIRRTDGI